MRNFEREIPGRKKYEHREVLYVELQLEQNEKINKYLRLIANQHNPIIPKSGGVVAENFIITTPDKTSFFGLSYNKDIKGWRMQIMAGAEELNLATASIVDESSFVTSENEIFNLIDCSYEHYGFYDDNKKIVNRRTTIDIGDIFSLEELKEKNDRTY